MIPALGNLAAEALPGAIRARRDERPGPIGGAQSIPAGGQIGDFGAYGQCPVEMRLEQAQGFGVAGGHTGLAAMAIVISATEQPGADSVWPGDQAGGGSRF